MVASFVGRNGLSTLEIDDNILWQPKLHKDGEEYCFAHAHTQHIKKTCHFLRDQIKKGTIIMEYVRFKD
jgi:hypothetical protein